MKRIALSIFIAMLFMLSTITAFSTEGFNTYRIDGLGVQIDIPSEMGVLTQNAVSNEDVFADSGVDIPSAQRSFVAANIYLNAVPKDFGSEIVVVVESSEITQQMWNLSVYDDSELYEASADFEEVYATQGINARVDSIYRASPASYFIIDLEQGENIGRQYYTIVNGQGISITMWSYIGPLSVEQADIHRMVAESIVFEEILDNPSPAGIGLNPIFSLGVLGWAIIGAIGGGIFWIVSRYAVIKKRLALCHVDDYSYREETFWYKDKIYSKEKYVENCVVTFRPMKNNEKQLKKLLLQAQKRSASDKAAAVLWRMEAEAIQRILSENQTEHQTYYR